MSLVIRFTISIVPAATGDPLVAFRRALDSAGLAPRQIQSTGASPDPERPNVTRLLVRLVADDPGPMEAAIRASLAEQGIDVFDWRTKSEPYEVQRIRNDGVSWDEALGVLTVDTWGPDWRDLDLTLVLAKDEIRGWLLSQTDVGVNGDGLPGLRRIIIRRPGGA